MAITYDADLGSTGTVASANSVALTTSAAAAAGSRVLVSCGWININPVITTVTGGGLTWVVDKELKCADGTNNVAIISADAPAGLASSTVITVNWAFGAVYRMICADSFKGIVGGASGYVDTSVSNDMVATTTNWTTGNVATTLAGDLIYAAMDADALNGTNTATAPSIETHDFHIPANSDTVLATEYRIESSASTYTVAGTLTVGSSSRLAVVGVAYKQSADVIEPADNPPMGFSGRGAGW